MYFASGVLFALLIVGWVYFRYGKMHIRVPPHKPHRLTSVAAFQPWIKALISRGLDGDQVFFRSAHPRFLVRVRKRVYKRQSNILVVEIRNSDANKEHYADVREVATKLNTEIKERFTPKQNRPKDIRLRYETGTYAPSAVTAALADIFAAAGADISQGVHVSDRDPAYWSTA